MFIPMKSPLVFLKTKLYLRNRWFYVNNKRTTDKESKTLSCGELIEPVHLWLSSGCVVMAVVPWLGLGCVSAVTMHSYTAVIRINVEIKP